jgi:hypothetical protein
MNSADRLYNLLPVIYRQRDVEQGAPLQMLLRVLEEQADLVEADIAQLYDNWFIETCQDWVVPYIAAVVGYRPVHPLRSDQPGGVALEDVLVPRREVANTIAYRRRKGTLALLEDLAMAVAGWPARAVEFERYVNATQSLDHLHLTHGRYADLHGVNSLDLIGTPFDPLGHSVDVRTAASPHTQGRYGAANLSLFVWRLRAFPVTHSLAYCLEEAGDNFFTFSILGNDVPLFNLPASSGNGVDGAREIDFPVPIRRRALEEQIDRYYGEGRPIAIWAGGWAGTDPRHSVPASKIVAADLSGWRHQPRSGHIAVDPELGRIAFPPEQTPTGQVHVTYAYGFAGDLGGGEYLRPVFAPAVGARTYFVGAGAEFARIHEAYEQWHKDQYANAIIEITDSGVYEEQLRFVLREGQNLELRAANGTRPVVFLVDRHAGRPDALGITGERHSRFTIDGMLVTGRGLDVRGRLGQLSILHSTLVPGWAMHDESGPRRSSESSLTVTNTCSRIEIDHSILGGVAIVSEVADAEPVRILIADSVLDGAGRDATVLGSAGESVAHAVLTIYRSTAFGKLQTHSIELAENSIFTAQVMVARKQNGCMRFCYVPPGSRSPRRYHCQPDLAGQEVSSRARAEGLDPDAAEALLKAEHLRLKPDFRSIYYGSPDFCRLSEACAAEIRTGAEDQSEMGVFHDLFQPQRLDNLNVRLQEYTPAGIDAGIIFAT